MSFLAPSWQRVRFMVCSTGGASEQLMPEAGKMQSMPSAPPPYSGPRQENPGAAKHRVRVRKEIRIVERFEAALPLTRAGTPA